jgi:hypothetical protein
MKVINLINKNMLEKAEEGSEGQAYFSKMKADFYRYMLEVVKEERLMEARDEANKAYDTAMKIKCHPGSPTRLSICLNMAIF